MKNRLFYVKNMLLPVLLSGLLIGCGSTENKTRFEKMEWLLGHWESTIIPKTTEKWQAVDEMHYTAQSYMLEKGDTIFSEQIELIAEDDDVFYIPSFEGQSGDNAAKFKLEKQKDTEVTFENKKHDYPQRIIYKLVSPDTLHARLEGKQGGIKKDFNYYFTRKKQL